MYRCVNQMDNPRTLSLRVRRDSVGRCVGYSRRGKQNYDVPDDEDTGLVCARRIQRDDNAKSGIKWIIRRERGVRSERAGGLS